MNEIIGWTFSAIVVLGIAAIALVAVWPRWRVRRALDGASALGVRRLPKNSPHLSRLTEPAFRDLIPYGKGCRITAGWELPLNGGVAVTLRCRFRVPRAGGTTTKFRVSTILCVIRPLAVGVPFTVQASGDTGAAGRLVMGLMERSMGAARALEENLDPAFRRAFTVRGPGFGRGFPMEAPADPEVPLSFQEVCIRSLQARAGSPNLARLMGEDGSLAVTPEGLSLTLGRNASPGTNEELELLLALLEELAHTLAG